MGEMMTSSKAGTTLPVAVTLTSIVPLSTCEVIKLFLSTEAIISTPSHIATPKTTATMRAYLPILTILLLRCTLTGMALSIV